MHRITILLFILSCTASLLGQDVMFTQYYQVPGQINPALTGSFGGLYRVGINYRDQWRPAVSTPFTSFSGSGDVKFLIGPDSRKKDVAALGIMFLSDRTDIFDFNTTGIALTGAFHKNLDPRTKQYIGGGVQAAIFQNSLNFEDLTFQDQFNAIDDYIGFSQENLPTNNYGIFDLNIGLQYSISPAKRTNFNLGVSAYHILGGNNSFFDKNDLENKSLDTDFQVKRRFNVHTSYDFVATEQWGVNPRAMASVQGNHSQFLLSNLFKFRGIQDDVKQFFFGPGIRLVNDAQGFGLESIILIAGIEYNGIIFGLSYDSNFADLVQYQQGLGTFEFSINLLGEYENENTFCPTF